MPCYPVCCLLLAFFNRAFPTLPPYIPLGVTHPCCAALRAIVLLLCEPPGHEPFGYFEDPPAPLTRLHCRMDPENTVSTANCRGESSVAPSVDRKTARSSLRGCLSSPRKALERLEPGTTRNFACCLIGYQIEQIPINSVPTLTVNFGRTCPRVVNYVQQTERPTSNANNGNRLVLGSVSSCLGVLLHTLKVHMG